MIVRIHVQPSVKPPQREYNRPKTSRHAGSIYGIMAVVYETLAVSQ